MCSFFSQKLKIISLVDEVRLTCSTQTGKMTGSEDENREEESDDTTTLVRIVCLKDECCLISLRKPKNDIQRFERFLKRDQAQDFPVFEAPGIKNRCGYPTHIKRIR
jgi:hypothetical protein